MDDPLLYGQGQGFFIFIKCKDLTVGMILADRLGDGAADQAQADETCFLYGHGGYPLFIKFRL